MMGKTYTLKNGTKLTQRRVDMLLKIHNAGRLPMSQFSYTRVNSRTKNDLMYAPFDMITIKEGTMSGGGWMRGYELTDAGTAALHELGLIEAAAPSEITPASLEREFQQHADRARAAGMAAPDEATLRKAEQWTVCEMPIFDSEDTYITTSPILTRKTGDVFESRDGSVSTDAQWLCDQLNELQAELDTERQARQAVEDQLAALVEALVEVTDLSNVGGLFDGHDELNEYTHEANANLMEHALDKIFGIAEDAIEAAKGVSHE